MNVLVIGAGGKTGKLVVERALAAGHQVTALVHADGEHKDGEQKDNERFPDAVNLIHGDARNPSRLDQVMTGQHAVIDTIGGHTPFLKTDLEASSAKVIVDVMKRNQVKRLIVISVLGVGESKDQAPGMYEHLLMPVYLRGALPDKAEMEATVEHSGLDFVIVRPPVLSDSGPTGDMYVVPPGKLAHKITRADLAQFLVDQLTSNTYLGQQVTVANS